MSIKATIDCFENGKAILILNDGQKIILDRDILNPRVREGDILVLNFLLDEKAKLKKRIAVKNIIKQILKKKK